MVHPNGYPEAAAHSYDGWRQILSLFPPGADRGEMLAGDCDRHNFDAMLSQNNALRAEVFRQNQDQLDGLHWLTWSLGALGAEERLCAFLALSSRFMLYQALPHGTGFLPMFLPRKDIADLPGDHDRIDPQDRPQTLREGHHRDPRPVPFQDAGHAEADRSWAD